MCGCLSHAPYWGLDLNPGTCCDWESNQQPFGSQPILKPLSYTSQGPVYIFFYVSLFIDFTYSSIL